MNRAQHETTERIKRDELHRLLNTMTAAEQQAITTRARISDIEDALKRAQAVTELAAPEPTNQDGRAQARTHRKAAKTAKRAAKRAAAEAAATSVELRAAAKELAALAVTTPPTDALSNGVPRLFNDVDWDELLTTAVSAMVTPLTPTPIAAPSEAPRTNRKYARPFSQVAALLPPVGPPPRPRPTKPLTALRAKTDVRSLAIPERKAARNVAEVRARLDSGQGIAACPPLSTQVVEQLSADEIAMLPVALRPKLSELTESQAPTPKGNPIVVAAPLEVTAPVRAAISSGSTVLATFTVLLLFGLCAIYFLF